jgi:hypothetical protein
MWAMEPPILISEIWEGIAEKDFRFKIFSKYYLALSFRFSFVLGFTCRIFFNAKPKNISKQVPGGYK